MTIKNEAAQPVEEQVYNLFQACNHFGITGISRIAIFKMIDPEIKKSWVEWKEFLIKNKFSFRDC